jgi:hypothetical protein
MKEIVMNGAIEARRAFGPKTRDRRHYSYDESADEPPSLIENESTDIESETPEDETEPVERVKDQESGVLPAFEE